MKRLMKNNFEGKIKTNMTKTIVKDLTISQIETMDFSSLVGLVREPNMCSGGYETIRTIIKESNLKPNARILEVGSNTGFSCIEFASTLPNAEVVGIDINPISVEFSKNKALKNNLENVEFYCSDGTALMFEDNSFDLVFCSNVTSFIQDREQAIKEYIRVLKPGGILAAAPIYYREIPPYPVKSAVEEAIAAKIDVWDRQYWEQSFEKHELQLYFSDDFKYIKSSDSEIENYTNMVMSQSHLAEYDESLKLAMRKRLKYFYELFDENLTYAGFSVLLYRYKSANQEPMLHKTCRV
ncbi:methyltransferase small domain protein (plasmid) [Bacillus pseudomycoides]|uniref:class I SAM-dependent methyltransferase n=2 Tax=Bacillus TaxID=1386 RepID=UPI0005A305F8|nr:class I SAM-dependent methyltransferase [Bacillus pseudomycoides]AJI14592.1 methyltransferase small domain protein [Bacillus pseudomycoides]